MADLNRLKEILSDETHYRELAELKTMDEVLEALSGLGIDVNAQELVRVLDELCPKGKDELDDDTLASVAGGAVLAHNPIIRPARP